MTSDLDSKFYHDKLTIKYLEIVKLELQDFVKDTISTVKPELDNKLKIYVFMSRMSN
ncbi:hypothetical protein [Borreliella garinii]|uniref:hypothetical protein n=1 Tax=Borreliella garinii TaxID=29519 RepID=UPI00040C6217|nr:hypothetical protein [Borreliella garinii]